jgi:hypothetical protein
LFFVLVVFQEGEREDKKEWCQKKFKLKQASTMQPLVPSRSAQEAQPRPPRPMRRCRQLPRRWYGEDSDSGDESDVDEVHKRTGTIAHTRRPTLFGIRIAVASRIFTAQPRTRQAKLAFLRGKGVIVDSGAKCGLVDRRLREWLEVATGRMGSLSELWHAHNNVAPRQELATVIGYLPETDEYAVMYDDVVARCSSRAAGSFAASPPVHMWDLVRDRHLWSRVPWDGNVLDCEVEEGERPAEDNLFAVYGPSCPRCQAALGVGAQAWAYCRVCSLHEPGTMWSLRFTALRNDPSVWPAPKYIASDGESSDGDGNGDGADEDYVVDDSDSGESDADQRGT